MSITWEELWEEHSHPQWEEEGTPQENPPQLSASMGLISLACYGARTQLTGTISMPMARKDRTESGIKKEKHIHGCHWKKAGKILTPEK